MAKTRSQKFMAMPKEKKNETKMCKPTFIRMEKVSIDGTSKKTGTKNDKSIEKNRIHTRGTLKGQSKNQSEGTTRNGPIEAISKRVQPKRIVKEQPKRESSPIPIKEKKKSTALIKPWQKMEKVKIEVEIGQLVLSKQKYSVPWPSKVLAIRSKTIDVHFYGDGRTGPVKCDDVYSIPHSYDIILDCLRRKIPGYSKGIAELERVMKIPAEASFFNFV